MHIVTVADDLTSATDGSVALAEAGWTVQVFRGLSSMVASCEVVALDTGSRTCSREDAIHRVTAVGEGIAEAPIIVKQVDSTLRGHVAAETLALLKAIGRRQAIVAPAFPSAGRITAHGCQLVDGIQVDASVYAQDPLNPVRCGDLVALFEAEGVQVARAASDRAPIIVRDASKEAHLDQIVCEYRRRTDILMVGSTGLLRALARHVPRVAQSTTPAYLPPSRRVLVVVGSINPQSRKQLELLLGSTSTPVCVGSTFDDPMLTADQIAAQFDGNQVVALTTVQSPLDPREMSGWIGQTVCELISRSTIDAIAVTGGETLSAILECLGVLSLRVYREIEPGVPLCGISTPKPMSVVSKAGGFGSSEVFLNAIAELRKSR